MSYGQLEYNPQGLPKCELCNKYFARVCAHVRQVHFMTALEYKEMFGFDTGKGILSESSREKSRDNAFKNGETVINKNLLIAGKKSRFQKGCKGRTRDLVSEQTRITYRNVRKGV